MVASIICVLNTGHKVDGSHTRSSTLLPLDQNDKYDLYIQRYAELVFRWGLLTKRVELLKHLSRRVPSTNGEQMTPTYQVHKDDWGNIGSDVSTKYGISFGGTCHRCSAAISTSDSIVCSNCRDYAVRCSICDNAVRGLFTVCARCGHGGHLNHIMSWFMMETKCPTGCGCDCVFSSLDPRDSPSALLMAEEPERVAVQRRMHPYAVM
jgi:WD repeat-containing protein 59